MKYLIIGDVHQGLNRKTGITHQSLKEYEAAKAKALAAILFENQDKDVIIAGDLYDSSFVPSLGVVQMMNALANHPQKIWVIAGNHDTAKDSTVLSSFDLTAVWSGDLANDGLELVSQAKEIEGSNGVWLLPHQVNQDVFDHSLAELAEQKAKIVITHCNYENNFAVAADHSLNMTKEQASKFDLVISGHEHNTRASGNVFMVGSLFPCTVDEAGVPKQCAVLDEGLNVKAFSTEQQNEHSTYAEVDWRQLATTTTQAKFVKIVGVVSAEEASLVLNAIAAFRKTTKAYMVRNAVEVETLELGTTDSADLENVNPLQLISNILSEDHKAMLKELGYALN